MALLLLATHSLICWREGWLHRLAVARGHLDKPGRHVPL